MFFLKKRAKKIMKTMTLGGYKRLGFYKCVVYVYEIGNIKMLYGKNFFSIEVNDTLLNFTERRMFLKTFVKTFEEKANEVKRETLQKEMIKKIDEKVKQKDDFLESMSLLRSNK